MENQSRKSNDDICLSLCFIFLICFSTSFPLPMSYNCILELIILPENCQTPVPVRMISLHPSRILGDGWFLLKLSAPFYVHWMKTLLVWSYQTTSCWNRFVYSSVYFQLYTSIWLIGSQLKCDDMVGTPVCLTKTVNFRTKANPNIKSYYWLQLSPLFHQKNFHPRHKQS